MPETRTGTRLLSAVAGRVLALDYGRRRIGVAVSDPTRTIASPHSVVRNEGKPSEPPEDLLALVEEIDPAVLLLGIPLEMDGSEGEMAREIRAFGDRLRETSGRRIVEWDERLTSAGAERFLRESGVRRAERRERGRTDMLAATMMLRSYLRVP